MSKQAVSKQANSVHETNQEQLNIKQRDSLTKKTYEQHKMNILDFFHAPNVEQI